MRLTDALLGEHGLFYVVFKQVEDSMSLAETADEARQLTRGLAAAIVAHAVAENELLLDPMAERMGPAGPVAVMRDEHQRIEGGLSELATAPDIEAARGIVSDVIQLAREHFAKEEQVLFPMARQHLGDEALEDLGRQWAERRGVAVR